MNLSASISLSTVRILCGNNGSYTSVGTGFFYLAELQTPEGVASIPLVITNKHVVVGFDEAKLFLTACDKGSRIDETGCTASDRHISAVITGLDQRLLLHPDAGVDLCAFPIQDISALAIAEDLDLRLTYLSDGIQVPRQQRSYVNVIEPIVMIGYPSGLWDKTHNKPLVRRGSTATHPFLPWNGKREFVIDAACFPGSSGSPVFLYEEVMFRTEGGAFSPGSKAHLLGILSSGPTVDREGRIIQREVPTTTMSIPIISMMINLGNVVHADAISDLLPRLQEAGRAGMSFPRAVLTQEER